MPASLEMAFWNNLFGKRKNKSEKREKSIQPKSYGEDLAERIINALTPEEVKNLSQEYFLKRQEIKQNEEKDKADRLKTEITAKLESHLQTLNTEQDRFEFKSKIDNFNRQYKQTREIDRQAKTDATIVHNMVMLNEDPSTEYKREVGRTVDNISKSRKYFIPNPAKSENSYRDALNTNAPEKVEDINNIYDDRFFDGVRRSLKRINDSSKFLPYDEPRSLESRSFDAHTKRFTSEDPEYRNKLEDMLNSHTARIRRIGTDTTTQSAQITFEGLMTGNRNAETKYNALYHDLDDELQEDLSGEISKLIAEELYERISRIYYSKISSEYKAEVEGLLSWYCDLPELKGVSYEGLLAKYLAPKLTNSPVVEIATMFINKLQGANNLQDIESKLEYYGHTTRADRPKIEGERVYNSGEKAKKHVSSFFTIND